MKNKPIIGVLPQYNAIEKKIYIAPPYMNSIIAGGGLPVVLPFVKNKKDIKTLTKEFDGFLFTGGQDINPSLYGQPLCNCSDEISPRRDELELNLFNAIIKENKPIFGICRGMQLINVALGGTLKQDILGVKKIGMTLQHFQKTPFDIPVHEINIEKNTLLYQILEKDKILVNSVHHQGIGNLADGLLSTATSVDNLVEAIEIKDLDFGIAVQWHPEQLLKTDSNARKLFTAFVNAAQK
ncbi:gamma-glutamyl-gamma-aminobutyrate hydrolase family protein [Acetobacterium tundrae]|uniref:Gamma-glutamyl-gamma-aminobutyrate hydrolase family protein n=1 Tax=Acetobacterium tundrae TaxID=132932 RepID=A0ABR6WMV0_9FIRM|nr:gamma-glutamyl-gamma-aminobutyrate hydrolase family protein [Acetobacterium tundrae]MBC3797814.1 gamma-glutamyl-gamma-aminobutyrate hydrolase family protein [Acetobacterium tundrae]